MQLMLTSNSKSGYLVAGNTSILSASTAPHKGALGGISSHGGAPGDRAAVSRIPSLRSRVASYGSKDRLRLIKL
ncbi:hypothetical protein BD626DRAFT_499155, partial [Schizophyllum amplum]